MAWPFKISLGKTYSLLYSLGAEEVWCACLSSWIKRGRERKIHGRYALAWLVVYHRLLFLCRLLSRPSGSSSMVDIFPRKTSSWVSSAQFYLICYGLPTSSDELNYSFFKWEGLGTRSLEGHWDRWDSLLSKPIPITIRKGVMETCSEKRNINTGRKIKHFRSEGKKREKLSLSRSYEDYLRLLLRSCRSV